jgi:hypothetical protein
MHFKIYWKLNLFHLIFTAISCSTLWAPFLHLPALDDVTFAGTTPRQAWLIAGCLVMAMLATCFRKPAIAWACYGACASPLILRYIELHDIFVKAESKLNSGKYPDSIKDMLQEGMDETYLLWAAWVLPLLLITCAVISFLIFAHLKSRMQSPQGSA